jgi:hypothetical protein
MAISRTLQSGNAPATSLLGSTNGWTAEGRSALEIPMFSTTNQFENGAITYRIAPASFTLYRILISQEAALRFDMATGQFLSGAHKFRGLPLVAMQLRTFENGTLSCSNGARCQGNYGGSFPAAYRRNITP